MPSMGSTRVQDIAEDQGVRRQKEEPRKRAKKENQQEEPRKKSPKEEPAREPRRRNKQRGTEERKTTRQYRGKTDTGGWKDSSLTLRRTAESGGEGSEGQLSRETELGMAAGSRGEANRRTKRKDDEMGKA